MNRPPLRRLLTALCIAALNGCDAPQSLSQQISGDWVGRPESAAERIVREWPTRELNPDDPEIAKTAAATPPTDLESFDSVRVELSLDDSGAARLSFGGSPSQTEGPPLVGRWSLSSAEGRRAVLEIGVQRGEVDGEMTFETRRFDIEVLRPVDGEGFVLREQNADRRFGRLIFRRPGDIAPSNPEKEATP
jgi:hypothetical protein